MKIGIAADHGGFALKQVLLQHLRAGGYEVADFGAYEPDPEDDYPDFVIPMAREIAAGKLERGIAVCGSGVGASVAANKVKGIRAALIQDHFSARQGVEDDDLQMICLGGRTTGPSTAIELAETFLEARFSGLERHKRRLQKIARLED